MLSNPSRADTINLLSAGGGRLVAQALSPDYNLFQCDVRLKEDNEPLLEGTKCVLLMGQSAASLWLQNTENTIGEIRGSVYKLKSGIPAIPTFFAQDAADIKNYEAENNPLHQDESELEDDEAESDEKRRHGRTKRKNYRFWLTKDIEKCKYLLKHNGIIPSRPFEPSYIVYPKLEEVCNLLTTTKNEYLYLDIETDGPHNVLCFSFSFSNNPEKIYCVPCILPNYTWAYDELPKIYRALAIAFRDNITTAYNGSGFDFLVFAHKYRIPWGKRLYDVMLAHHRCFPEIEKSLGHATSLHTWEPFHKDEGSSGYMTMQQAEQKWRYCGKDVFTMVLIHKAIEEYAKKIPGLQDSIKAANDAINAYMLMTLQGFLYDEQMVEAIFKENDRLMMQYNRMLGILIGKENLKEIAGKSLKSMPGSNKQCVKYFHEMLGYPVIAWGKEGKTGKRNPSLGKTAMFKLALKYNNPVINIVLAFRECAKESGSLKFNPWNGVEKK